MSQLKEKVNVLILGAEGQLGQALKAEFCQQTAINPFYGSKAQIDITQIVDIQKAFKQSIFDVVINCAAYTQVEQAEVEPKKAHLINHLGAENIAKVCAFYQARLIHLSTDYVFSGKKSEPYTEQDEPQPINVYGASKLQGELAVIANAKQYYILRTSWLFSEYGANFVKTIHQRICASKPLQIINDQFGGPTYAPYLAKAITHMVLLEGVDSVPPSGIYHYANAPFVSWYELALSIKSLCPEFVQEITPVTSDLYQAKVTRPSNSCLNSAHFSQVFNHTIPSWKTGLSEMFSPKDKR